MKAIGEIGYERPSPIQAMTIPHILEGKDIIGQAQTGTGKTASFALPILSKLDINQKDPQALILTPTRELAIQVAEAFQKYASALTKFHVLPVYGGREYTTQLKNLKRGTHVIVGTPGRVMDHIRRGTLKLDGLKTFVLDEADEMLKMGFIDDIKWIMDTLPKEKQLALFSATMPTAVRKIASKYLTKPVTVSIESKTSTADTVRQRYCTVKHGQKLEALTRILETETIDAVIVFVRTKSATVELADRLKARGFAASALNGDIDQRQREKTVNSLKKGKLDLVVATDVAARGLDVERVSHVINFDIPFGTEAYVHRIGRTGRAGRKGDAILFVSPRETRMLKTIEKATKSKIKQMAMPSQAEITSKRKVEFNKKIAKNIESKGLKSYSSLIKEYLEENEVEIEVLAAALYKMAHASPEKPLEEGSFEEEEPRRGGGRRGSDRRDGRRSERSGGSSRRRSDKTPYGKKSGKSEGKSSRRSYSKSSEEDSGSGKKSFKKKDSKKKGPSFKSKDGAKKSFAKTPKKSKSSAKKSKGPKK